MKRLLFILIIYLTYISLGLPDSLLGVTWPEMMKDFPVQQSAAGIISMTVSSFGILSSIKTSKITNRLGIGRLILTSVLLTSLGLTAFSLSQHFLFLLIASVPLGLGAGAIDTSLNNYVSVNLKAYHMNWLHAFWGVGATAGPLIMGFTLRSQFSWRTGYAIIGGIQLMIAIVLYYSLPMWKHGRAFQLQENNISVSPDLLIKNKGIIYALLSFLIYVALEGTVFLWGSSYLIRAKSLTPATASFILSIFFISLTLGRVVSGFVTLWLSNQKILYLSMALLMLGIGATAIGTHILLYLGLSLIGLGCAAIFPTMMHETPRRFGEQLSSSIIGLEIAAGSIGIITVPPLFGIVFQAVSMTLFPVFLAILTFLLFILTRMIDRKHPL